MGAASRRAGASGDSIEAQLEASIEEQVGDDLLYLIFMCCHPVLSAQAQVALTLRLLGGLKTEEIARAFLVSESTMAQRIVRAKRTFAEAGPVRLPRAGCAAASGCLRCWRSSIWCSTKGTRPPGRRLGAHWLCEEALRLGRVLAERPEEPEVHGLVALMEIQASRLGRSRRRLGRADSLLRSGPRAVGSPAHRARPGLPHRAERLGGALGPLRVAGSDRRLSWACPEAEDTDWVRVAALYEALARLAPSPVVELNRAVALASTLARP